MKECSLCPQGKHSKHTIQGVKGGIKAMKPEKVGQSINLEVEGLDEIEERVQDLEKQMESIIDDVAVALATLIDIKDMRVTIKVDVEGIDN